MGVIPVLSEAKQIANSAANNKMTIGSPAMVGLLEATLEPRGASVVSDRVPEMYSIKIDAKIWTDGFDFDSGGEASFEFSGVASGYALDLDLGTMTWELRNEDGVVDKGSGLDSVVSASIFGAVGLDIDQDTTVEEAGFFLEAIQLFSDSPRQFHGTPNRFADPLIYNGYTMQWKQKGDIMGTGMNLQEFTPLATGVVALIVYFAGLVFFLRKRAKPLRVS